MCLAAHGVIKHKTFLHLNNANHLTPNFPCVPTKVFRYSLSAQNNLQLHRCITRWSLNIFFGSCSHISSPFFTLQLGYHELWRAGELRASPLVTTAGFGSWEAMSSNMQPGADCTIPLSVGKCSPFPGDAKGNEQGKSRLVPRHNPSPSTAQGTGAKHFH